MALPEITGDRPCLRRSRNPLHFVNNDGATDWQRTGQYTARHGFIQTVGASFAAGKKTRPPGGQKIPWQSALLDIWL
jgi:hypothetical protein